MAFPKTFQPEQGEQSNNYTLSHLESGSTVKLRVMSDFITGNSVWGENKEGKRVCTKTRDGENIPVGAIGTNKFTGMPERIKQFVASVVYNYDTKQLEILETDKATIIEQLYALENTEEYGDLKGYDIKIGKNGQKTDTTYSVIGLPPKAVDTTILTEYKKSDINLEKLFTNEDPFQAEQQVDEDLTSEDVANDVPF